MRARVDLDSMFAGVAESVANATLRLDQASRDRLAELEGRTVQVESAFPGQVWSLRVREGRIEVLAGLADSPDVVVRGKPQDLLAWFVAPEGRSAQRLDIQGDAALLTDLAGVFRELAPMGMRSPIAAEDLLGAAELAGAVLRSAAESIAGAWREATADRFVNRSYYDDFQGGIEQLRDRVERLSTRVRALEAGESGQAVPARESARATGSDPDAAVARQRKQDPQ